MIKTTKSNIVVRLVNRWLYRHTNICIDYQPDHKPTQPVPDMQINATIHPVLVYTETPTRDQDYPDRGYINMIPGDSLRFDGVGNAVVVIKPNHIESDSVHIP